MIMRNTYINIYFNWHYIFIEPRLVVIPALTPAASGSPYQLPDVVTASHNFMDNAKAPLVKSTKKR